MRIIRAPYGRFDLDRSKPRWPDILGEKRPVWAHIHTWIGTEARSASHFTVSVCEEDNAYWCESEDAYVREYDEPCGLSMRATVFSEEAAVALAKSYFEIAFDSETHRLEWKDPEYAVEEADTDG